MHAHNLVLGKLVLVILVLVPYVVCFLTNFVSDIIVIKVSYITGLISFICVYHMVGSISSHLRIRSNS